MTSRRTEDPKKFMLYNMAFMVSLKNPEKRMSSAWSDHLKALFFESGIQSKGSFFASLFLLF